MPTLGWGSELKKNTPETSRGWGSQILSQDKRGEKRMDTKKILLVGADPDSLSYFRSKEIAKAVGNFEAMRIYPVSRWEHDKICRDYGNQPVVLVGPDRIDVVLDAVRRGVTHYIFWNSHSECPLERLVHKDGGIYFEPIITTT